MVEHKLPRNKHNQKCVRHTRDTTNPGGGWENLGNVLQKNIINIYVKPIQMNIHTEFAPSHFISGSPTVYDGCFAIIKKKCDHFIL